LYTEGGGAYLLTLAAALLASMLVRADVVAPRPSIVLISVDTLRPDHLGSYGYARRTSPFIDSLARRGTLFETAYVPRPATSPSHASMLTGVQPWRHGVLSNGMLLNPKVDTLAAALKRAGYDTGGVVAVAHIGSRAGFARGFDRFFEPDVKDPSSSADTRRFGEAVNADARKIVDAHAANGGGKPLFLFVHYFECHYPYRAWDTSEKEDPWTAAVQADRARQLRRYDDGVKRVDDRIAELCRYVKAKLGTNVVICITGDHGEQIGDHGLNVGHADIYRETVHVPLIVAGPSIPPGVRVKAAVSTMDIPVLLAGLGGARMANPVDGRDPRPLIERSASWLHQIFSSEPPRRFLVTGAPAYTRSLALIDGSSWFIKNLDFVYRTGWIQTPATTRLDNGKVVAGTAGPDDTMSYQVPFRQYKPFYVVIEHRAKDNDCAMTASASLAPGIAYWDTPVAFKGSIRMVVPAARLDSVTFTVAPARCAGTTLYGVARIDDLKADAASALRTDLYLHLAVPRRGVAGDELYDAGRDRRMVHNLIGRADVTETEAALRSLFGQRAAADPILGKVPPEIEQQLRSLGYLH
jgi:hypothetical protein